MSARLQKCGKARWFRSPDLLNGIRDTVAGLELKNLDAAAIQLSQVCGLILDRNVPDLARREAVFAAVAQENVETAVGPLQCRTDKDRLIEQRYNPQRPTVTS
jgi:hypothetical protein